MNEPLRSRAHLEAALIDGGLDADAAAAVANEVYQGGVLATIRGRLQARCREAAALVNALDRVLYPEAQAR